MAKTSPTRPEAWTDPTIALPAASISRRPTPAGPLERAAAAHVTVFVAMAAWALGGNSEWARILLSCWGSLGVLLTILAVIDRRVRQDGSLQLSRWLWPLLIFDLLVAVSLFNPNFRQVTDGLATFFVEAPELPRWTFLPSTARPDQSLQALWFFNVAYLSCFNVVVCIRRRRTLRRVLLIVGANAVVLAVFGTLQKLLGAKGVFFGLVKTPQPYFFASFIYHNHWGAFTLLMIAVLLGLVFHHLRRRHARDFWHSPAFAGVVAVIFVALTIPLSTSRSSTVLVLILLAIAFMQWVFFLARKRRAFNEPVAKPLVAAIAAVVLAASFIYQLAQPIILVRLANTRDQIALMKAHGEYMPRAVLYRDTWRLAREKIWFGWGMGAYPTAFYSRNTQQYSNDGPNRLFHDAHSDWLQSVSEVGLVGTALLGLCALVPLSQLRRASFRSPIVLYLILGCSLVVAYAWLEFPFGNRAVIIAFWMCLFSALQYARLNDENGSRA